MKKAVSLILAVLLVLTFAACVGSEPRANPSPDQEPNPFAGDVPKPEFEERENGDLTIAAYFNIPYIEYVIPAFEEKYGLAVKVILYEEEDTKALDTKLMAKDNDIDLFLTPTLPVYKYVRNQYYTDLKQYEGIKQRIEGNSYTKFACCYNDEYFGLPFDPYVTSEDRPIVWKYLANCLSLAENSYTDPNGEEFEKLLEYVYKNPEDEFGEGYYGNDKMFIINSYIIMSPFSQNKETAALFLETAFDFISGELSYTDSKGNVWSTKCPYPDVENIEKAYFSWNITTGMEGSVIEPLYNATVEALKTDGSEKALRKLAEEAAYQVRMRIEG